MKLRASPHEDEEQEEKEPSPLILPPSSDDLLIPHGKISAKKTDYARCELHLRRHQHFMIYIQYVQCKNVQTGGKHIFYTNHMIIMILYI